MLGIGLVTSLFLTYSIYYTLCVLCLDLDLAKINMCMKMAKIQHDPHSLQMEYHELNTLSLCRAEWVPLGSTPTLYCGLHELTWARDQDLALHDSIVIDYAHEHNTDPVKDVAQSRRLDSLGIPRSRQLWCYNSSHLSTPIHEGPYLHYDFFAADTLWRHQDMGQEFAVYTDSRPRGALCMTAQLVSKPRRARVLHSIWSEMPHHALTVTTGQRVHHKSLNRLGTEFAQWCKDNAHSLDSVKAWQDHREGYARGWPVDPTIYDARQYSIVMETYAPGVVFLGGRGIDTFPTEKIYRTIACQHPFILDAEPGLWDHMQGLGYRLYHDYPHHAWRIAQLARSWYEDPPLEMWREIALHNHAVWQVHAQGELDRIRQEVSAWLATL